MVSYVSHFLSYKNLSNARNNTQMNTLMSWKFHLKRLTFLSIQHQLDEANCFLSNASVPPMSIKKKHLIKGKINNKR